MTDAKLLAKLEKTVNGEGFYVFWLLNGDRIMAILKRKADAEASKQ
jgi:hypothetical protein